MYSDLQDNGRTTLGGIGMTVGASRTPRILIVTANFSAPGVNTWLLDDLAESLVANGATVDVLVDSPTAPRPRGPWTATKGIHVYSVGTEDRPAGAVSKALSYAETAVRAHTQGWRWVRNRDYDLCISTSISSFSFGLPSRVRVHGVAKKWLVIYWDFFPVHNIEIGRIRQGWLAPALRVVEERSMRHADAVALTSPAGQRFFRKYFPALRQRTFQLPPWSRDGVQSDAPRDTDAQLTLTFGGQLVAGRNLETLIRAMALLPRTSRARLVMAGAGPLGAVLESLAMDLGAANVEFTGQLDRERYFELLQRSDVGVTTIAENVSAPAYPSKIAGYAGMGLPILMTVDPVSDYGEQVQQAGAGIAVPAGNVEALAKAILRLEEEFESGALVDRGRASRRLFETRLSSDSAARAILQEMDLI